LLQKVLLRNIRLFEEEFLHHLELNYKDMLNTLREGKLTDEAISTIEKVAKELSAKYEK
jgi:F-type H+-transporting ATPase subunit alpha